VNSAQRAHSKLSASLLLGTTLAVCGCDPRSTEDAPIAPNADGTVSTIAGTGSTGYGGDGLRAVDAQLHQPMDLAFASSNALLIADFGNHRVRQLDMATGRISTIAGTGQASGPGAIPFPTGRGTAAHRRRRVGNLRRRSSGRRSGAAGAVCSAQRRGHG
jgi:hypothetical protein